MRVFTPAAMAAIMSPSLGLAMLVEMDLSGPLYLNTTSLDLTIGTAVYYGTRGFESVEPITTDPTQVGSLRFSLSGVPQVNVALALAESVKGKPMRLKLGIFAEGVLVDAPLFWAGTLDTMQYSETKSGQITQASISVAVEGLGIDLIRPTTVTYSDADQQRAYPGDLFFQYTIDQSEQDLVWPSKNWGRQ